MGPIWNEFWYIYWDHLLASYDISLFAWTYHWIVETLKVTVYNRWRVWRMSVGQHSMLLESVSMTASMSHMVIRLIINESYWQPFWHHMCLSGVYVRQMNDKINDKDSWNIFLLLYEITNLILGLMVSMDSICHSRWKVTWLPTPWGPHFRGSSPRLNANGIWYLSHCLVSILLANFCSGLWTQTYKSYETYDFAYTPKIMILLNQNHLSWQQNCQNLEKFWRNLKIVFYIH